MERKQVRKRVRFIDLHHVGKSTALIITITVHLTRVYVPRGNLHTRVSVAEATGVAAGIVPYPTM